MKVLVLTLFVLVGLSLVSAEIIPRFPPTQPLSFSTGNSTAPAPPPSQNPDDFVDKTTIDPFEFDTAPPVILVLANAAPPAVFDETSDVSSSIIGGERDIRLTAETGNAGLVFTAGATGGVFSVATPNQGSGFVLLQYDGVDGTSDLNITPGLGIDLTTGGAVGFRIEALTDVDTEFTITIYDDFGESAFVTSTVTGGIGLQSYFIPFDDTNTIVDFTQVAAIEFFIEAFQNVDFTLTTFVTFGPPETASCQTGTVLPCDFDYYRLEDLGEVNPGDYIVIEFTQFSAFANTGAHFYVRESVWTDLESELETNENVIDTIGDLPGPFNYTYTCEADCKIEIVWSALTNLTYYLAVEGYGYDYSNYTICLFRRDVPVIEIFDETPQVTLQEQRATIPPDDRVRHYSYYFINVDPDLFFVEGSYLTVNISRVAPAPGTTIRLMYESLPETAVDTGIIGRTDFNSEQERVDDMIFPWCVERVFDDDDPFFFHPIKTQPRIPCECFSDVVFFNNAQTTFQLTCALTVDPCHFSYGNWYISVELYERDQPEVDGDQSGFIDYTLTADVVSPNIHAIYPGNRYGGDLYTEKADHYRLEAPRDEVQPGLTHMVVHLTEVRNGWVDLWVHQGLSHRNSLAGGLESCAPANATCHTSDACYVVIPRCEFDVGFWYISVSIGFIESTQEFELYDVSRGVINYVLQVDWEEDLPPVAIYSGTPVFGTVGERLYNFYVLHVPQTVDTWLHVELYARGNDTEVIVAALHGELPGGDCYARPDFFCMTGDPRGLRWSSGPYSFNDHAAIQRESCSFMIEPCHLQAGPLFFSVYGAHEGYNYYGDTTYYDIPVSYTLWVDFDVPLALVSGRSLTEVVVERQYQHYYIRADQVPEGAWLSVEITNVRHGIGASVEGYVNFNQLAGDCPCYEHLYSCTNHNDCPISADNHNQVPENKIDIDTVFDCCTIVVPPSDFKSGVWYVGVAGVFEDYTEWTTPIGYTLTVTVHEPPVFNPLLLGQPWAGELPQWNRTLEYAHFSLYAAPVPDNQLVFQMTWIQNCEFFGKHDDTFDVTRMYVNLHTPAGKGMSSHRYWCQASTLEDSYCTIVIPECQWEEGTWFVAVQGDYDGDFIGRFTLRAFLEPVRDYQLSDGVPVVDSIGERLYNHYFIESPAEEDRYLWIELYPNNDQDVITAYLNHDARAGAEPCYTSFQSCTTKIACSWQILACDLRPGRYYISVQGAHKQFYDIPTEYTLVAEHKSVEWPLHVDAPVTGHLYNLGDLQHYSYHVGQIWEGGFLLFTVDNVKHGAVSAYVQYDSLAGKCPCFSYLEQCHSDDLSGFCQIEVPSCELQIGTYFFSVVATDLNKPASVLYQTPLGYTAEVQYIQPVIKTVENDLGRQIEDTLIDEFVGNGRYRHYQFYYDDDDYQHGTHVIVEITEVREGNIRVFYNYDAPGSRADGCHQAEICNDGVSSGSECFWQIPYCILDASDSDNHFLSIYGEANREAVQFNILVWRQTVLAVNANPGFTLDNVPNSSVFPNGVELNVTHSKINEPNGWTQFIRLPSVDRGVDDLNNGQMLELFFYRVTAPFNEPMSFNVYVHPTKPAGAHGCCDRNDPQEYGACQEAPCLNTVDTTTKVARGAEVFTHTCVLGNGLGFDAPGNPFYGSTCTVRVWPCEFNKYCDDVRDWYVSVVPIAPVDNNSEGVGVTYSFQWRTRDIRLSSDGDVGSVNLTQAINTYNYTGAFSVPYLTTESEGWRSFFVNVGLLELGKGTRLSIQTKFITGTGTVYIRGDDFAAAPLPYCSDYECHSNNLIEDCSASGRFIVSDCCATKNSVYFITVRNNEPAPLEVAFRIIITVPEEVEIIPDHPPQALPYFNNGTDINAYIPGFPIGVAPESYDHYQLLIDDDDLAYRQSWIIDIERNDTSPYALVAFIRYGAKAGNFDAGQLEDFYDSPEGCYSWQYSCYMPKPDSRCIWLLPHCDLVEGYWYISIWNPSFVLDHAPINLPDYFLSTFIEDPPYSLDLNSTINIGSTPIIGILTHFFVNVTAEDLTYDLTQTGAIGTTYWNRYLRVEVSGISGDIDVYLNYDDLAGPDSGGCLTSFDSVHCDVNTDRCYMDVLPCTYDNAGEHYLKTGVYFIGVRVNFNSTYNVTAYIVEDAYTVIPPSGTVTGTGHRNGTTDQYWQHTFASSEIITDVGGNVLSRYYRYYVDLTGTDSDDFDDNTYVIVNLTSSVENLPDQEVHLHMWRDDCTVFHCDIHGPETWCVIDALTLEPCSLKGGRFFFIADNPSGMNFTLTVYLNETTIQTIEESQTLIEEIFPYEYQEYFFETSDLGENQGATLAVRICALCGDVQAWIRPDLPAGPSPDITGAPDSCALTTCNVHGDITQWGEEHQCCDLFLDTCEIEQRGYYIGVRGVSTVFPNAVNEHLYLPAKYSIQPIQTNLNFTRASLHCAEFVEHYSDWNELPVQYFVDVESLNVGNDIRVSLLLPSQSAKSATVWFNINHPVGYSSACRNEEWSCSTTTSCSVIIPYCALAPYFGGRYYIWADAPRGSEIRIERWDNYVPYIHRDLHYSGSINHPVELDWDVPYHGSVQYYRFDIAPPASSPEFFNLDRFFGRVKISNVQGGLIRAHVNSGFYPATDIYCDSPVYQQSCTASDSCHVDIELGQLNANPHYIPTSFFLGIEGISQDRELRSIHYEFVVQTNWVVSYLPLDEQVCGTVNEGDYSFHIAKPHQNEEPHQEVLHLLLSDIDSQAVTVYLKDNQLATQTNYDWFKEGSEFDAYYYCGYENLHLSVHGLFSLSQQPISYRLQVLKETVKVKELFDDTTSYADDDDDDACPHEHDFWVFDTSPNREVHPSGSFFRIAVDSIYQTQVYINKGSIAWENCHDSGYGENDPLVTGTTTVNVYDFCDFDDGTYYVTVVSDGPYYIYSDIRDDVGSLTLGEPLHDVLEPGMYKVYTLELCADWFSADDRLVVEITDVENGGVYGWIQLGSNPGIHTSAQGDSDCSIDSAHAEYGNAKSGYDFLLVNSCELSPGTYHILIRAAPHPGAPERNCQHVKYRLFAYLTDYEIDPVPMEVGDKISDELVNLYTIDRIEPDVPARVNYYTFLPFNSFDGYSEGTYAKIRVNNVQGGLLRVMATRDHLAIPEWAFTSGEINGLSKTGLLNPNWKIQTGRRPFSYQQVLDPRQSVYHTENSDAVCSGCADFCVEMNVDDSDYMRKDKSVALFIPPCYLTGRIYIAVEAIGQFSQDHDISYDIHVDQEPDFTLLQPDRAHSGKFTKDNWNYDLYYSISAEAQSMRWRVVVNEGGEGVLVTVRNHRCPAQATWEKQIWCDADYFDRPYTCEVEIPSRAAHPGDLGFYLWVYGKNATYEIDFWRGRENCHEFDGTGREDGLDFCAGLVPYATWRWDNYHTLDSEANCFFEQLFDHFKTQPCWNGVSRECNSTLQAFACYESFHGCDRYGFATGTCQDACDAVVYECLNTFDAVDLEHYNCTSSRYLDSTYETCSGAPDSDFATWNDVEFLVADPNLLLFKSTPSDYEFSYGSASAVSVSVMLIAVLAVLLM